MRTLEYFPNLVTMFFTRAAEKGDAPFLWRKQDGETEAKARDLLVRFKLDAKSADFAASLSGGQRKLLEMARALMSVPTLVMLDEPMAGVNPALTQSLLEHILGLKDEGMTVLFVEHDMHMVRHIADWVIVMAEGKIVAEGPPDTVMNDQAVIDAYIGALPFISHEQAQMLVFVLIGIALMLLVIFRPQGILGNKKELTFVK